MEVKIQCQIIDYFSFFDQFFNTTSVCLCDCRDCAASINKLLKRYTNIKTAVIKGTALEEFESLQNKLKTCILNLISDEIQNIKSKQTSLKEIFEKLCHKNKVLLETCKVANLEKKSKLTTGTPLQPPLCKLLEFAEDTVTFGSQILAQIETALNVLSYKRSDTEFLVQNFCISSHWHRKVAEIISYTSFCSENQI